MTILATILGAEPSVLLAVAAGTVLLIVDLATSPRQASKNASDQRGDRA